MYKIVFLGKLENIKTAQKASKIAIWSEFFLRSIVKKTANKIMKAKILLDSDVTVCSFKAAILCVLRSLSHCNIVFPRSGTLFRYLRLLDTADDKHCRDKQ